MKIDRFEDIIAWQKSKQLTLIIYKEFKDSRDFGFKDQIQRAAVSVAANIAEGSSRFSRKDFTRYLQISYGSLMEVLSHAYVAYDRKYLVNDELKIIRKKVGMISSKLNSLSRSLK